jgi:multicomponent Na+:H+ antiporter subunit G
VSWLLLSAGGVFVLIGGIGALRMPNLYTRMHAASVTDSWGRRWCSAG